MTKVLLSIITAILFNGRLIPDAWELPLVFVYGTLLFMCIDEAHK